MKWLYILSLTWISATVQGQFSVSELPFIGSGDNRAILVLDFNNGQSVDSFAWGYRFNGTQFSGADLLIAVAASDPSLTLEYGGSGEDGFFLSAVSYQYNGIEYRQQSTYPTASWGYYLAGGLAGGDLIEVVGGESYPVEWEESMVGASDTSFGSAGRILSDLAWDYWSVGAYDTETFAHLGQPSGEPIAAPIPESSSMGWIFPTIISGVLFLQKLRGHSGP